MPVIPHAHARAQTQIQTDNVGLAKKKTTIYEKLNAQTSRSVFFSFFFSFFFVLSVFID